MNFNENKLKFENNQYPNKDRVTDKAKADCLAEFMSLVSDPNGVPVSSEPDAYDLTLAQFISAFDNKVANAIINAPAGSVMDTIVTIFTQTNLNRNYFLNKMLTWMLPDKATGVVARSIAALKGATPEPATRTSFAGLIKGQPGTVIYPTSFIKTVTAIPSQDQIYFNPNQAVIGDDGYGVCAFACQNYGAINLQYPTKFEILTSTTGWESVEIYYIEQAAPPINIGHEETTDYDLMNISNLTLYRKSHNGYNAIIGDILSTLGGNVNTVQTAINNTNDDKWFPLQQRVENVYKLPPYTLVVSVLMQNSDENIKALGNILFMNLTACDTGYPVGCPAILQKTATINTGTDSSPNYYEFKYIIPEIVFVEFKVNYEQSGNVPPDLDAKIAKAIIDFFEQGNNNYSRVLPGETFNITGFSNAIAPLGLPPYSINMNLTNKGSVPDICTPIWQQPVTDNAHIYINGRVVGV